MANKKQIADNIIDICCKELNVTRSSLVSPARYDYLCEYRRVVYDVLRKRGFTVKEIGTLFKRDHSTVVCSLKKPLPSKLKEQYRNIYMQIFGVAVAKEMVEIEVKNNVRKLNDEIENILYDYYEMYLTENIIKCIATKIVSMFIKEKKYNNKKTSNENN